MNNSINTSNNKWGYHVRDTNEMVAKAIRKGFELVNGVRLTGKQLKEWSRQTLTETNKLIETINQFNKNGLPTMGPAVASKNTWEIAYWENEISRKIRVYFMEVSNCMSELKKLNPPLSSTQLEPFLNAMLSDRRKILIELEPLSKIIGELQQLKNRLYARTAKFEEKVS